MWERPFHRQLLGTEPAEMEVQTVAAHATHFPRQLPLTGGSSSQHLIHVQEYRRYRLKETLRTICLETTQERCPSHTNIIFK